MAEMFTIDAKSGKATGCLIFLHGSGDTGPGFGHTVIQLKRNSARFPDIKILFPTAPLLPFSAYGGMTVNTWYDISAFTDDAIENTNHIEQSARMIKDIIKNEEVSSGIPVNRMVVAGFSRGGAMSYYMGYSCAKDLAGVGVLSSWLPRTSNIYSKVKEPSNTGSYPPLFQCHGGSDFVINKQLAEKTVNFMKSNGIKTEFKIYPSVGHEVSPQVLTDLYSFVEAAIPNQ